MPTYKVTVNKDYTIQWYNNKGQRHRLDGPAIEWADGAKAWFVEGKFHRFDGPAVEYADGSKEWWVKGKELTKREFNAYIKPKPTHKGKKTLK